MTELTIILVIVLFLVGVAIRHRRLLFFVKAERVAGVIVKPLDQFHQDRAMIGFWTKDSRYLTLPVNHKDTNADLTKKADVIVLYDPENPEHIAVKNHPHGGR